MKTLKRLLLASMTVAVLAPLALWCAVARPWRSAEDWMKEFDANPWPEDMQIDPLILAGDRVVPLVIERIQDPGMPKRASAIWFLGCRGYQQSKPTLLKLIADEREDSYIRGYALIALYQLNRKEGLELAARHAKRADQLGVFAREVLEENEYVRSGRTYLQAFLGEHD